MQQSKLVVGPPVSQLPSQRVESAASDISRYESASSVMAEPLPSVVPETGRLPSQQQPAAAAQPVAATQRRFVGNHQKAHAESCDVQHHVRCPGSCVGQMLTVGHCVNLACVLIGYLYERLAR